MTTINIQDMERDLAGYLRRVQAGETLLVLDAEQPLAEIKPPTITKKTERPPRPFGLCRGDFIVPDDFDAALPEDILQDFEGASIYP